MLRENENTQNARDKIMYSYLLAVVTANNARLELDYQTARNNIRLAGIAFDASVCYDWLSDANRLFTELEAGRNCEIWLNLKLAACLSISTNLFPPETNGKADDE